MAYNIFGAVGITGDQPSTLNKISIDVIKHDDFAIVSNENKIYFYKLDAYSSLEENLPYVVKPIDITESTYVDLARRRWILISQEYFNSNLLQTSDKSINTSKINALPGLPLEVTTSNGMKIFYHTNGIVAFPNSIIVQPPTIGSHATTKTYVDDQIATVNSSLNLLNSTLRNYADSQDVILQNFLIALLNQEIAITKTYVDDQVVLLNQEIAITNTNLNNHIKNTVVHYNLINADLNFKISIWEEDGGLYYYDVAHNKNQPNVFYKLFQDDKEIFPLETDMIDLKTLKVWMPNTDTITGILIGLCNQEIPSITNADLNFKISIWEEDAGLYYYDIVHNKNKTNIIYKFFQDDKEILPFKTEMINLNTLRVWMLNNDIITGIILGLCNQEPPSIINSEVNFEISIWEEGSGLYYYDIVHNKNKTNIIYKFFQNNEEILPLETDMIDLKTLRVWMPENTTITGILI